MNWSFETGTYPSFQKRAHPIWSPDQTASFPIFPGFLLFLHLKIKGKCWKLWNTKESTKIYLLHLPEVKWQIFKNGVFFVRVSNLSRLDEKLFLNKVCRAIYQYGAPDQMASFPIFPGFRRRQSTAGWIYNGWIYVGSSNIIKISHTTLTNSAHPCVRHWFDIIPHFKSL